MCFDADSAPPIPVDRDAVVDSEQLVLTGADGNRFAAFVAAPGQPSGVGVVVLPDIRGLYRFYTELALRFAENGHTAAVVDYYGRTAGVGARGDDFPAEQHMNQLTPRGLYTDLTAAIEHLRGRGCDRIVTIGFCLGGRLAVLAATGAQPLAGVIGFYCWPAPGPGGAPGPTQRAAELTAPVLALMAGDDPAIPQADVDAFEQALATAGVDHEVVTYDGAPHSFFDAKQDEFAAASADAWQRVLGFVARVGVPA
jgi:carboxymethylenebutenolidase